MADTREDNATGAMEKSIHRLVVLGVALDYTLDYAGGEFRIVMSGAGKEEVIEKYARYIAGYNKGRVKSEVEKIRGHAGEEHRQFVISACAILTSFIYDTIEKGRRNALSEMLKLAESALGGNADERVRERVLRYLESTYSEEIESVLNGEGEGFEAVRRLIEGYETEGGAVFGGLRSPKDAAQIRGQAARYLESNPDHPGLYLLRAISETYCSDADIDTTAQNILAGIRYALQRGNMEKNQANGFVVWIMARIYEHRPHLYPELATRILRDVEDAPGFAAVMLESEHLDEGMAVEPGLLLLNLTARAALESLNDK